jgi:hypothetical protein
MCNGNVKIVDRSETANEVPEGAQVLELPDRSNKAPAGGVSADRRKVKA